MQWRIARIRCAANGRYDLETSGSMSLLASCIPPRSLRPARGQTLGGSRARLPALVKRQTTVSKRPTPTPHLPRLLAAWVGLPGASGHGGRRVDLSVQAFTQPIFFASVIERFSTRKETMPDVCRTCLYPHPPELPHNADSAYYQHHFRARRGRSATWQDAMSHCEPDIRRMWAENLAARGIGLESREVPSC